MPAADSKGERRFNSIKSGSCVTPDPIRLLAAVHEPDLHDNVARDSRRDRQRDRQMDEITTLGSSGGTVMVNYSWEMNSI